jgi:hypothetical protein
MFCRIPDLPPNIPRSTDSSRALTQKIDQINLFEKGNEVERKRN